MSEIELITATPELLIELGNFLQGPPGATGATGPQGAGIIFKGEVATVGDLPVTAETNDCYLVTSTGDFYVWSGSWINIGPIGGPKIGRAHV